MNKYLIPVLGDIPRTLVRLGGSLINQIGCKTISIEWNAIIGKIRLQGLLNKKQRFKSPFFLVSLIKYKLVLFDWFRNPAKADDFW